MRTTYKLALCLATMLVSAGVARAQTQVKARAMVMVDSSGSMVWHFGDCSSSNGDSGSAAVFCDNNIGTGFACNQNVACTIANGGANLWPTTIANPSRLYAAKAALQDVLNAESGSIDFGLERYALARPNEQVNTISFCPNSTSCCQPQVDGSTRGRCIPAFFSDYPVVPSSVNCPYQFVDGGGNSLDSRCDLTFMGGCGTSAGCSSTASCTTTQGGQVLILPAASSSASVSPWIDFVEDFCSSTASAGGAPRNPELRAVGGTPLAGSVRTARQQWYQPIYNVSKVGAPGFNKSSPLYDAQLDCRSYVNVVMTDGGETCEDQSVAFSDPQTAVQELTNVNPTNPVKTYVIAMSFAQNEPCNNNGADSTVCPKTGPTGGCSGTSCSCKTNSDCGVTCDGFAYTCGTDGVCHHPALASLNGMAAAGGTGFAHFANNQTDIEAAFADIAASTVKVEKCNDADDDCNGVCDEPFPDVAITNAACSNKGRLAKSCDNGALAGTKCYATGSYQCSGDQRSEFCSAPTCAKNPALCPTAETTCNGVDDDCNGVVDDCTPFVAGSCCTSCTPSPEVCDGKDNDCNGKIDDNPTDVGLPCGTSVGVCMPGTTVCTAGKLVCSGGTGPSAEVCDNKDNNCNGQTDEGLSQACYPFAASTRGKGICKDGVQVCSAGSYGSCNNAIGPQTEICNGLDDDCDGIVDDNVAGVGVACCPTGNLADCMGAAGSPCMMGKIACMGGAMVCVGGVAKSAEQCDGVDNDCNGAIDDVPGINSPCVDPTVNTVGECTAAYTCKPSMPGSGPNKLTCTQIVGPTTEICDLKDNDCNGKVDDVNPATLPNVCPALVPLPGTSFPASGAAPPCSAGMTVCQSGNLVCVGQVGPQPNQCNGISTDCTGMPNTNGNCPTGFMCFQGNCVAQCSGGEFPCPGGFVCRNNLCIPDGCAKLTCPTGQICKVDDQGNASCIDPCVSVMCPSGFKCKLGACVDDTCKTFGCPTGQICTGTPPACQADPCFGVTCPSGQSCVNGTCQAPCSGTCPGGQVCVGGVCQANPCTGTTCPEGQVCVVQGTSGQCVQNMCGQGCDQGKVCCQASCHDDPCQAVKCQGSSTCKVDPSSCVASCIAAPAPPKDQIVGAGGGGFSCDATPGGRPVSRSQLLFALALLLGAAGFRRRFSASRGGAR